MWASPCVLVQYYWVIQLIDRMFFSHQIDATCYWPERRTTNLFSPVLALLRALSSSRVARRFFADRFVLAAALQMTTESCSPDQRRSKLVPCAPREQRCGAFHSSSTDSSSARDPTGDWPRSLNCVEPIQGTAYKWNHLLFVHDLTLQIYFFRIMSSFESHLTARCWWQMFSLFLGTQPATLVWSAPLANRVRFVSVLRRTHKMQWFVSECVFGCVSGCRSTL